MWSFVTGFSHLVYIFKVDPCWSIYQYFILLPNNVALYGYTTFCLIIPCWFPIWVVSTLGLSHECCHKHPCTISVWTYVSIFLWYSIRKTTSFLLLSREKPISSLMCLSFLCVSFTTHTKHLTSDTFGHQMREVSPHTKQFSETPAGCPTT